MTEFVLVPGAWLGSWAWDDVVPELRAAGHGVHPLTLSGLADKKNVAADLRTHVQDIVDEVEDKDLRDVILVAHSYSGVPTAVAAQRIGDRLSKVVFVDSKIPVHGESFVSAWPENRAFIEGSMAENAGFVAPMAAADYAGQGLTDDQIARLVAGSTPHPGATLTQPATLSRPLADLPATYVKCLLENLKAGDDVLDLLAGETWRLVEMDTGHWPMFSQPGELARILLEAAESNRHE